MISNNVTLNNFKSRIPLNLTFENDINSFKYDRSLNVLKFLKNSKLWSLTNSPEQASSIFLHPLDDEAPLLLEHHLEVLLLLGKSLVVRTAALVFAVESVVSFLLRVDLRGVRRRGHETGVRGGAGHLLPVAATPRRHSGGTRLGGLARSDGPGAGLVPLLPHGSMRRGTIPYPSLVVSYSSMGWCAIFKSPRSFVIDRGRWCPSLRTPWGIWSHPGQAAPSRGTLSARRTLRSLVVVIFVFLFVLLLLRQNRHCFGLSDDWPVPGLFCATEKFLDWKNKQLNFLFLSIRGSDRLLETWKQNIRATLTT